ncbi:hypothetical protein Geob_1787 [Geotalea daltonii FRC-32]|uniref:Uncharacterized protein n=1 Tax=Geotalea daltonii (strain DSM 22248 / JCM 15807 / FRC-32) TaxID=316067 RepID=B9M6T5_GEODF|nr:hypothetical protein [Geotalea daltonii]ACM20145.1 hypothetical protein Geob_1787 [Geotalea daltonii FRC-32]
MRRSTKALFALLALSAATISAQGASANGIGPGSAGEMVTTADLELGQSLTNENLDDLTGRQNMNVDQLDMQLNTATQLGEADGNLINDSNLTTGANGISGNAFAQASGLVTVIQNSGNQVLIQNDLIMNLTVK